MKISTKARYALVALADLGEKERKCSTLQDIAERQDISFAYLEQIFIKLRRAGIVSSIRGPKGGYHLARSADEIRVIDIVKAVEETVDALHRGEKIGGGQSGSKAQSLSNRLWESMSAQVYVFLHSVNLADILDNKIVPCQAVPMLFDFDSEEKTSVKF